MEHWTPHDIRRSVATGMVEMGIPGEHIEQVLGHSMEKLRRTYNKHTYASEVREGHHHRLCGACSNRAAETSLYPV